MDAQENQGDIPSQQEVIIPRNPLGQFIPGHSGNPAGKSNILNRWQPYGQRAVTLGDRYSEEQILEFYNNPHLRRTQLSYWDSLCVVQMARAIERSYTVTDSGADQVNKEREALLNRIEGTPVQTIRTGAIAPVSPQDIDSMTAEEKERIYQSVMKS